MKKGLTILFVLMITLLVYSPFANAQDKSGFPFVITPMKSDIQAPDVQSYFDLEHVQPGKTYHLKFNIRNTDNHSVTVHMEPVNAYTSSNGGILYRPASVKDKDKIINKKFRLADHLTLKNEVILKGHETKTVRVNVDVPQIKKGVILGGILFSKVDTNKRSQDNHSQFSVESKTDYAVAIKLNVGEPGDGSLKINSANIKRTPSGPQIDVSITNKAAAITKHAKVKYSLNKEGKDVFKGTFLLGKFAPMTKVDVPIRWKDDVLKSGEYSLHLEAKYGDKSIDKTLDLAVKDDAAFVKTQHIKQDSFIGIPGKGSTSSFQSILYAVIGAVIGALLVLGIVIIKKRSKGKSDNEVD